MKQQLPDGYNRFALRYQCLRKGYGACLYANRYGRGRQYQEHFFHREINKILLMLFLVLIFVVFLYFLYKIFF